MFNIKKTSALFLLSCSCSFLFSQKIIEGKNAHQLINGASFIRYVDYRQAPDFILLNQSTNLQVEQAIPWMREILGMSSDESMALKRMEKDNLGMIHYMYQHSISNIPVEHSEYRLHTLNNKVVSLNGEFYKDIQVSTTPSIDPNTAIKSATHYIGAKKYKWEIQQKEDLYNHITQDQPATFIPQPELTIIAKNGDYKNPDFRLCWKMDIYAVEPLSRHWVYVDAQTSEVIFTVDRICSVDAPGTAHTAYSGSRSIVADSFSGGFRLQETGRGNGIQTFDMNQGTVNFVDFTDTDNDWNNINAQRDQYATDAHWGAEMVYDYYLNVHSRNSIDNSGLALLNFVHFDVGFGNAFWDGASMHYGDGDNIIFNKPLTTLDIVGHEITHGLTQFTAGLSDANEGGALNESFSDIFGVTIDNFAKGTSGPNLWILGEECTVGNTGIRSMNNPNAFGDPDTYHGIGWENGAFDNGGVHINAGVQNHWYYLMCEGGSGTNDNADTFNITGMGMANAANIAFRSLTIYLGPNSQYADARFFAIRAAQDLFGPCSPEVEITTNAWHAVGVGPAYAPGVQADFISSATSICNSPSAVQFTNLSNNAINSTWDFGDGTHSTEFNPLIHIYSTNGTFDVSLITDGGACGADTSASSITINLPPPPVTSDLTFCDGQMAPTLTASGTGTLAWFNGPFLTTPLHTGNSFTTPPVFLTTTFYVSSQVQDVIGNVGPIDNTIGSGSNDNSSTIQYMEFTTLQTLTLNTVDVFSTGAGIRNIKIMDINNFVFDSIIVNIPNGSSTVTLNRFLYPGTYRLGGIQMNLYKNTSGASYPYDLAGIASITGSSGTNDSYFYFYNWNVSTFCSSDYIPATIHINQPIADFFFSGFSPQFTFFNNSANATSFFWDFGVPAITSDTSIATEPTFTYPGPGTYTVMLIAKNNGCFDTTYQNVVIADPNAGIDNLEFTTDIFPNPFNNFISFSLQLPADGNELNIDAYNAIGQKVKNIYHGKSVSGQFTYNWNSPENMAPGIYFIKIAYNGKELVKRVIKL